MGRRYQLGASAVHSLIVRIGNRITHSKFIQWVWSTKYLLIYSFSSNNVAWDQKDDGLNVNSKEDLDYFVRTERWLSKKQFIEEAERRFCHGLMVYSLVENGVLVSYGWLVPSQKRAWFPYVHQPYVFPEKSAVMFNDWTHPNARGRGLHSRLLRRRLYDAAFCLNAQQVFIAVEYGNRQSQRNIESVGFECIEILYEKVRFGRRAAGRMEPQEFFRLEGG